MAKTYKVKAFCRNCCAVYWHKVPKGTLIKEAFPSTCKKCGCKTAVDAASWHMA